MGGGGAFLGVPMIKVLVFGGTLGVPLVLGNTQYVPQEAKQ